MRQFDDIQNRWSQLTATSVGFNLRQAVQDEDPFDPCEEGLRSICWRAFLLYGPLSKGSWTKKLSESRSAYVSLRNHFLKYIDNPNEFNSSSDPLTEDTNSPWTSLRQDELSREEIYQDVARCMQDNHFFREPSTQRKLLDILFIYAKLNPDTGYRQGMHELLAPVLWVVSQDAVDTGKVQEDAKDKDESGFMLNILDKRYIEHDAFNLFCAIMQTAKSFYELGENNDSAAIVAQSSRIHDELLAAVDPDLALHLQIIGVLPQVYAIRWIRLLFGREFEFKALLRLWDLLFAENLSVELVDMTCVSMLLRLRWSLIDADYTSAITTLNRFKLPNESTTAGPRSLVKDALYLSGNRTPSAGANIIQQHSGQRPDATTPEEVSTMHIPHPRRVPNRWSQSQSQSSPLKSPSKFGAPQKQLESLFQEVSGSLQKRTEEFSKTIRGAVGEVRRNVSHFQSTHSRTPSLDVGSTSADHTRDELQHRLAALETRNKALAKMLETTLDSLRAYNINEKTAATSADVFNTALAKIQFVSVYLSDSDIPVPFEDDEPNLPSRETDKGISKAKVEQNKVSHLDRRDTEVQSPEKAAQSTDQSGEPASSRSTPNNGRIRPSLTDSSFSFMLGKDEHRYEFVSSTSPLPEQDRGSTTSRMRKGEAANVSDKELQSRTKDDGFTLSPLQ